MWVPLLDDEHEDQREQHAKQSSDGSVILLVRVHESLRLAWVYPWSFGGCANRQRRPKKSRGGTRAQSVVAMAFPSSSRSSAESARLKCSTCSRMSPVSK